MSRTRACLSASQRFASDSRSLAVTQLVSRSFWEDARSSRAFTDIAAQEARCDWAFECACWRERRADRLADVAERAREREEAVC